METKEKLKEFSGILFVLLFVFLCMSFIGSMVVIVEGTCGVNYPIGMMLYLDLFCEIKGE